MFDPLPKTLQWLSLGPKENLKILATSRGPIGSALYLLYPLITTFQSYWPAFYSVNMPSLFLPQGLCTCSFPCLECSFFYLKLFMMSFSSWFRPWLKRQLFRMSSPIALPKLALPCPLQAPSWVWPSNITLMSCIMTYNHLIYIVSCWLSVFPIRM